MGNVHLHAYIQENTSGGKPVIQLSCQLPERTWALLFIDEALMPTDGGMFWKGIATDSRKGLIRDHLTVMKHAVYADETLRMVDLFNQA